MLEENIIILLQQKHMCVVRWISHYWSLQCYTIVLKLSINGWVLLAVYFCSECSRKIRFWCLEKFYWWLVAKSITKYSYYIYNKQTVNNSSGNKFFRKIQFDLLKWGVCNCCSQTNLCRLFQVGLASFWFGMYWYDFDHSLEKKFRCCT